MRGLGLGSGCTGALRLLDKEVLRLELRLIGFGQLAELGVGSVGLQLAQLRRVAQARGDVVEHLVAQPLVKDRPCDLNALLHVARHEVGAGQEDLDVLAWAEAVDAAVLEQTAYDGHHTDVIGVAGHARDQARYAAHEQRDRHACLACLGDLDDDVLVGDAVGLEEQPARLAFARKSDLLVDVGDDAGLDLQRRHGQDVIVVGSVLQLHVAEEFGGIAADGLVGGDEAQVGVELRRLLVVVARAQLRDVLQAVLGLARDAADLAVHLVIAEAVDDVAAGFFEALRPLDVVGLVEACAQLEQRGDLLAGLGGGDERLSQVRLARQAVQRDLDGDDGGVGSGLAQQLHERVHGLVGIAEQHLALADLVDDGAVAVKACRPLRGERGIGQRHALLLGQVAAKTPGPAHVERHAGDVGLMRLEVQAIEQKLLQHAGKRALGLQAHRCQATALLQDALHVLAVILVGLVGVLRGIQVGIARDAQDVGVLDGVHAEHLLGGHLHRVLEQDELEALARQLDDARALARHGKDTYGDALGAQVLAFLGGRMDFGGFDGFAVLGLVLLLGLLRAYFLVKAHDDVERPVLQVGEGVARVDDLRGQKWHDVGCRVVGQEGALLVVEIGGAQVANAVRGQGLAHLGVGLLLHGIQLVAALVDGGQLLGRRHARLRVEDLLLQKRQVG